MPKTVDEQSSDERRENFRKLMDDVVLPQRERLLQARDHTWQSAYVDDDGYLAELIAALVLGVPGTGRRGVSTSTGDLRDGTEVKKGYRVDPNIDFLIEGTTRQKKNQWYLDMSHLPKELHLPDIISQLNSNSCSVQRLEAHGETFLGTALWRTLSKNSLVMTKNSGVLRFVGDSRPTSADERIVVCIRQERGHINFGKTSRAKLDHIITSKPVLVFYQHDVRGRFSVAVVRVQMNSSERRKYLDSVFGEATTSRQIQPYLFPDNRRDVLYKDSDHSVADGLRGRLLAYGVHGKSGFEVQHWNVTNPPLVAEMESLLTAVAVVGECPSFRHTPTSLDWGDVVARREYAKHFFDCCIVGYSRALHPYCDMTGSTRNIGLGNLAQHLAGLCMGLRGTRSGARGADLVEPDGRTPSEIKLATGQRGDTMGTEDMPRLTLGWDHEKMLRWKRLVAVRMVEIDNGAGPQWNATIHAPSETTMKLFRAQVTKYFAGRVNNGSGGLQYHTTEYPHDAYGTRDHTLDFTPVAMFREGSPATYPNTVPEW